MGGIADGYPEQSDGLRCPTCGRTFSQKAGERHIPQCKNIINKPKVLMKGSGAPSYTSPESNKYKPKGSFGSTSTGSRDSYGSEGLTKYSPRMAVEGFCSGRPSMMSGRTGSFTSKTSGEAYLASGRSTTTTAVVRAGSSGMNGATMHSNSSSRPNSGGLSRTVSGSTGATAAGFGPSGRFSQPLASTGVRTGAASSLRSTMGGSSSMAVSRSSQPSPRVYNTGAAAASATGRGTGSGQSGYQLSHSNTTSRDNPLSRY